MSRGLAINLLLKIFFSLTIKNHIKYRLLLLKKEKKNANSINK